MFEDQSIEHKLAQVMINLRKGCEPISSLLLRRDLLKREIEKLKVWISYIKEENKFLNGFKKTAELVVRKNGIINDNDVKYLLKEIEGDHFTKDIGIQTYNTKSFRNKSKERLLNNLMIKENFLKNKLNAIKLEKNHQGPDYLVVKRSEYNEMIAKIQNVYESKQTLSVQPQENNFVPSNNDVSNNMVVSTQQEINLNNESSINDNTNNNNTDVTVGNNENNGLVGFREESDEEGVRLLLSMKRNVWSCKCGEFFNTVTDWSEHRKICNPSVEKSREQCQLCKKTFVTCVALNIHSTKKHNKKRIRTDSILKCPCGQTFKARWRQNCVHKLNTHGRYCKAFKKIEMRCDICKKGFICRKSLEFHGLKAHKLPVPVNSE